MVPILAAAQSQEEAPNRVPLPSLDDDDKKLPNGKSQHDAIARSEHAAALKDADQLIELANEIKSDLEKAGSFVVPLATVKKTEEAEKLAKKIRGRLKS